MNRNRLVHWVLFSVLMLSFSAASHAQVFVSVRIGPPALPVYAQPICPGPGYVWTPGYWAWNDDDGYYWVPGTWVVAPVGLLWTPGYWGWAGGLYVWHVGYWGPHVGFYGGINYGFGYGGVGFEGGEWRGRSFYYNRSVTNVNVTNVTNIYNKTVIVNNTTVNRVSYNGGEGGLRARPTHEEERAEHEHHREPLADQERHEHAASQNRENFARENHGRPSIAATARPAEFSGHGVVRAQSAGAAYHAPAMSPREARVSSPAGERGMQNHPQTAENRSKSNDGFRPFTPPNNRGANAQPANRGFNPPNNPARNESRNEPGNGKMGHAQSNPMNESRGNARENSPRGESQPKRESRSFNPPRNSESRQSAPRHESAPPAPQRHESAPHQDKPQKEHHNGR